MKGTAWVEGVAYDGRWSEVLGEMASAKGWSFVITGKEEEEGLPLPAEVEGGAGFIGCRDRTVVKLAGWPGLRRPSDHHAIKYKDSEFTAWQRLRAHAQLEHLSDLELARLVRSEDWPMDAWGGFGGPSYLCGACRSYHRWVNVESVLESIGEVSCTLCGEVFAVSRSPDSDRYHEVASWDRLGCRSTCPRCRRWLGWAYVRSGGSGDLEVLKTTAGALMLNAEILRISGRTGSSSMTQFLRRVGADKFESSSMLGR